MTAWLRGEGVASNPPCRVFDFDDVSQNEFVLVDGIVPGDRPCHALLINGISVALIIVNPSGTWSEAARQLRAYETACPAHLASVRLLVAAGEDGVAIGDVGLAPENWHAVPNGTLGEFLSPHAILLRVGAPPLPRSLARPPRLHQLRAARRVIQAWRQSTFTGMVSHAEGSGRTFTLGITALQLARARPVSARLLVLARTRARAYALGSLLQRLELPDLECPRTLAELEAAVARRRNVVTTLASASQVNPDRVTGDGWVILADGIEGGYTSAQGRGLREALGAPMYGFTATHPLGLPPHLYAAFGDVLDVWHPAEGRPLRIESLAFERLDVGLDDDVFPEFPVPRLRVTPDGARLVADHFSRSLPAGVGAIFLCSDQRDCRTVAEALAARAIGVASLDGTSRDRATAIRSFRDPASPVRVLLCATLPTGIAFERLGAVYVLRNVGPTVAAQVHGLLTAAHATAEARVVAVGVDPWRLAAVFPGQPYPAADRDLPA